MVKSIRWGQLSAISCFISILLSISFAQTEDTPPQIPDRPQQNLPKKLPKDPTASFCPGPGGSPGSIPGGGSCK